MKRFARFGVVLLAAIVVPHAAAQTNYPEKPVRVMVGVTLAEMVARMIGPGLTE
jgi:hypothetical protein